jgi:hypothetical protein
MGRRTARQVLGHDRDEIAGRTGTAVVERPAGRNVRDHLLQLQRDYGNTAVTTVVQRKGGKKAAPKQESYFPEWDPTITSSPGELKQSAGSMLAGPDPERIRKGIHWYEQAYLRETDDKQRRGDAFVIARTYEKIGESKRSAWWIKVSSGEIDPFAGEKGHA